MRVKVKTETIDSSTRYLYRTRTTKIKVGTSLTISTPLRAITSTEMTAKATIPAKIPIDAEIGEIMVKLTTGKNRNVVSFLKKNSTYDRVRKSISYQKLTMSYFPLSFVLIQPTTAAIKVLENEKLKVKFLRMVLDLQIRDINSDIIAIPWVNLPPDELLILYRDLKKSFPEKEVIIFLDPTNDEVLEKYLELLKPYFDEMNFIGVLYRKIESHKPSYDTLWDELHDKDVAIILTDVKRVGDVTHRPNLSVPHYAEFIVGDVIAREVPLSGGRQNGNKDVETQIRFFVRNTLTVDELRHIKKDPNWIDKIASSLNNEEFIVNALEHYYEAQEEREKRDIINAISKIHEFKESRDEFLVSQKYIAQEDTRDYLKEKEPLRYLFLQQRKLNHLI